MSKTEKQLQMTAYMEVMNLDQAKRNEALAQAVELIYEIMTDQVNDADECEKFLRAYAPSLAV